jgi:hypothetical protein
MEAADRDPASSATTFSLTRNRAFPTLETPLSVRSKLRNRCALIALRLAQSSAVKANYGGLATHNYDGQPSIENLALLENGLRLWVSQQGIGRKAEASERHEGLAVNPRVHAWRQWGAEHDLLLQRHQ